MLFQHFDWDLTHQVLFFAFCLAFLWTWLERLALKLHILCCRADICSSKLSAKVSLMLDNPFPVPSLCILNHISVCFIQIRTKITCKQLIPFRENYVFFEVIPGILCCLVNFNITWRFLLRRPVFPDYLCLVTMIYSNNQNKLQTCNTFKLTVNKFEHASKLKKEYQNKNSRVRKNKVEKHIVNKWNKSATVPRTEETRENNEKIVSLKIQENHECKVPE